MFGEVSAVTDKAHGTVDQHIVSQPSIIEIVSEQSEPAKMKMSNVKKLIFCALGIFLCYFYYGIIQEKITQDKYGEANERFHYTLCLVFIQCIINAVFSYLVLHFTQPGPDKTHTSLYATCAVSYLGAMLASNHALQHVNYPTQVLGKSCKPIPVMILGVLLARKRYTILKYLFVILIVAGVALFMYKDGKQSTDHEIGWGELLLFISLTLDGVTGATQERMRSDSHTNSNCMMLNVNIWSSLYLLIAIFVTGEVFTFIQFAQKYPYVLGNILTFSAASALGQYFIFFTVSEFGPLTCSIVTTTRKLFTILASVIIFNHPMTSRQWIGTAMVFVGLGLDSAYGKSPSSRKK